MSEKIPVKIGVQTMMWGKRLTKDQLIQMLVDIAQTAKDVFPDIKEIGIEFGQKIHHLGYDLPVEHRSGDIRRESVRRSGIDRRGEQRDDDRRVRVERRVRSEQRVKPADPDDDIGWESGLTNYTQVDLFRDLFLGEGIDFNGKIIRFDGVERPRLVLLGFSGRGSLEKRIKFCKILNTKHGLTPKYLIFYQWCDDYKRLAEEAAKIIGSGNQSGVPLAFHPFHFGPANKRKQIDEELRKIDKKVEDPQVQFVPDTAHLWLANKMTLHCDPNDAPATNALIWIFENQLHRITAFHLKDWKKTFDSSLRYYSRGFTALGGEDGYLSSHADSVAVDEQRESDLGKFCQKFEIDHGRSDQTRWKTKNERWVVFEQDFTIDNEKETLLQSLEWFKKIHNNESLPLPAQEDKRKRGDEKESKILPATLLFNKKAPRMAKESEDFDARKRQVIGELHCLASDKSEQFVAILQDLCRYLFYGDRKPEINTADEDAKIRSVHVALWEMSPRISTMVLLNESEQVGVLTANRSCKITNDACTGFRVWELLKLSDENEEHNVFFGAYNTSSKQLKERFDNLTEEEKKTSYDTVIWIPICNSYNYNQIEAKLDIFVNSSQLPVFQGGKEGATISIEQQGYQHKLEEYFDDLVQNIGSALEKMWGNVAYQTTTDLIGEVEGNQTSNAMLKKLVGELKKHFVLTSCIYFGFSKEKRTLREYAPWSKKTADQLETSDQNDPSYQSMIDRDFVVADKPGRQSWMAFPIYDSTIPNRLRPILGIIRCGRMNKSFTASDENTAHELITEFVPLFMNRYVSERRMGSISFLRHELQSPVSAVTNSVESLVAELTKSQWQFQGNRDYVREIKRYVMMMDVVLDNAFFLTGKEVTMDFSETGIPLITHIVTPAIDRCVEIKFSREKVHEMRSKISVFCNGYRRIDVASYFPRESREKKWKDILKHGPSPLHVDGPRLLQVFFNLLVNAIKYRDEARNLKIEIYLNRLPYGGDPTYVNRQAMGPSGYTPEYDQRDWAVEILFCDNGLGIPETCNKFIFEEGFRASNAERKIQGDGLGLWVCQQILQMHQQSEISLVWNGGIFTPGKPTMFRILLDKSLDMFLNPGGPCPPREGRG